MNHTAVLCVQIWRFKNCRFIVDTYTSVLKRKGSPQTIEAILQTNEGKKLSTLDIVSHRDLDLEQANSVKVG